MRTTKNWGTVSSGAELHMLAHAERTRKRLAKKKPTGQRLSAFKVHNRLNNSGDSISYRLLFCNEKGGVVICHEIDTKTKAVCR